VKESYPFPWQFDPKRYRAHYLMSSLPEARVQADIVELLTRYRVDVMAIDAGGRRQRGRMMAAAAASGVDLGGIQHVKTGSAITKGFSDLEATLAPLGRALYIEVKAPAWIDGESKITRKAGEPSQEQLDFLLEKYRRGALVLVAWASADVENYLLSELEMNRRALR